MGLLAPRFLNICAILPVSNVSTHRFRFYLCALLLPVETVFLEHDEHDDDHDDEDDDDGKAVSSMGPSAPRFLNICAILPESNVSTQRFRFYLCAPQGGP